MDGVVRECISRMIQYISQGDYDDFIEVYESETGIRLDRNDAESVDLAASKWDNHIYCDAVKVYYWLEDERLKELQDGAVQKETSSN